MTYTSEVDVKNNLDNNTFNTLEFCDDYDTNANEEDFHEDGVDRWDTDIDIEYYEEDLKVNEFNLNHIESDDEDEEGEEGEDSEQNWDSDPSEKK